MNEATKTIVFAIVAVVAIGAAWAARPASFTDAIESEIGKEFFPDFDDPAKAASLEILKYDEDTGEIVPFQVAKSGNVWSIPSKFDYPADAEDQLAGVAAEFLDLTKLNLPQWDPAAPKKWHAEFGVVDPQNASAGDKGIGTKVTFRDASGKVLAEYLIGNQVDADRDAEQRYVREPGSKAVYTAKVDLSKVTTRFADWIEDDLLKLNAFDLRRVQLDNHKVDEIEGRVVPGELVTLDYDDEESKWSMEDLADTEELDTQKVNDLKYALDDLKIVDVRKKPAGLSAWLQGVEGASLTTDDLRSLQARGFFMLPSRELRSNEGEVVAQTKDGVTYVLRFGRLALGTEEAAEDAGESTTDGAEELADDAGANGQDTEAVEATPEAEVGENRYVFVSVFFDEGAIPKPELEPLPGEPAGPADPAGGDADEGPQDSEADATEGAEGAASDDEQAAERKRVQLENERKEKEYNDKLEEGRKLSQELNDRFADWYYVISDDVYQKIDLDRAEIVKAKEQDEADISDSAIDGESEESSTGVGVDAFEELRQGLPDEP